MKKETQQDKILAMHEDGFTPREMYESLGGRDEWISIGSIYSVLSKFRLKANTRRCPHCGQHYSIIKIT